MNNLIAVLGVSWGLASIWMGGLADKIGRRKVLIPSIVVFSLASALTGLAGGLLRSPPDPRPDGDRRRSLLSRQFRRDSGRCPSGPARFAQGFQQSTFALIGLGFGPIIATQLLESVGWRGAFFIVALPA